MPRLAQTTARRHAPEYQSINKLKRGSAARSWQNLVDEMNGDVRSSVINMSKDRDPTEKSAPLITSIALDLFPTHLIRIDMTSVEGAEGCNRELGPPVSW